MSSNQWEVVVNTKKIRRIEKKQEEIENKKKAEPKLSDILSASEYKKLLSQKKATPPKEKTSPAKSDSSVTKTDTNKKATVKRKSQQQHQKATHAVASKPKNLESAIRGLTPDDIKSQLAGFKELYPGSQLLWLKSLATYLNSELPFETDATFSNKSSNYPLTLVAPTSKVVLEEFLHSLGEVNVEYFYHILLDMMCIELSKNLPVVGYKLLLQIIAQNWPKMCVNDMAKAAILRNSYQNRSPICLSLLWAIGQGGYLLLAEGLKVWQNLMLPCLELKNYSKFVTDYMERILKQAKDQSLNLNQNDFFAIYNVLRKPPTNIPLQYQLSLVNSADSLLQKFIMNSSKHANIFITLLRDVESLSQQRIELDGCLNCVGSSTVDVIKVWKMNFKKQLTPSLLLLRHIDKEWPKLCDRIDVKAFQQFLEDISKLINEMQQQQTTKGRSLSDLDELLAVVKNVSEKTAQQKKRQASAEQKKGCSCCKWVLGSVFIVALIAGALSYDTQVNGNGIFAKSAAGKALQSAGLLPYVEKGWYTTMSAAARGYKWSEEHVPPYAKPFCNLLCDTLKVVRNAAKNIYGNVKEFVVTEMPVVAKFIDQYVPGLSDKIGSFFSTVCAILTDTYTKIVDIFKTQVFVGNFSPENIAKSLNQTRNLALDYYNEFHKKVDAYAKLK